MLGVLTIILIICYHRKATKEFLKVTEGPYIHQKHFLQLFIDVVNVGHVNIYLKSFELYWLSPSSDLAPKTHVTFYPDDVPANHQKRYKWAQSPLTPNGSRSFYINHDLLKPREKEILSCSPGDIWISIESTKGELKRLDDATVCTVVHAFVKQKSPNRP